MINNKNGHAFIGSLSWYDNQFTQQALDEFWLVVVRYLNRQGVHNVSSKLKRHIKLENLWENPQLIVGQCCGPDLFTQAGSELSVIARPVFPDLDCQPGYYFSYIVGRIHEVPGAARIAVNSPSSRSGCLALMEWMKENEIEISSVLISGSHRNSLALLEQNQADLVAIDAHALQQCRLQTDYPVIGRSREALTPPFISHSALATYRNLLFNALRHGVKEKRCSVGISDLIMCGRKDYADEGKGLL